MASASILVVDDETAIADLVEVYLSNEGFTVHKFHNAADALACVEREDLDLAILDVMLPDVDGFTLCQRIREEHLFPILMLTAKVEDMDKITGLTLGADDYITKPFSVKELAARVRAVIRRQEYLSATAEPVLSGHGITLDYARRAVTKNGLPVELTHREFELLYTLMKTPGRVFTREMLLDTVWKVDFYGDTRTVDVHVRYLRQKLEDEPDNPKRILTVRGVGYRFAE